MRGVVHPGVADMGLPRLYPATCHRGHKRGDLDRIMAQIPPWAESFGEAFGGTAIVGWRAKAMGLRVLSNDIMAFSHLRARVLIANSTVRLDEQDIDMLLQPNASRLDIARSWYGSALGDERANWFDNLAVNLRKLADPVLRDVAVYVAIVCLMARMNHPQVRFTVAKRFAGRRFLDGFKWGPEFRKHALNVFPRLLHDNGLQNEAFRRNAVDFVRSHPVDCLYLDPPFVGPSRYEQDLGFYDKLVLIAEGRQGEISCPHNGPVPLPPHTGFGTRKGALMGLALLFRAASHSRRIILSYNTTSGIHPDEIVADGQRIYGPLTFRDERDAPLKTSGVGKPRRTRDVLLVFDRR